MSMLAEYRRKQKVSLNPRGKWWTEDPNKFGQKMLEKMGWTKGKGLGANEQGVTEYSIKSIQKTCTTGIGYDENSEKWTEHHEKFSGILKHLQENQNQDIVQKIQNKDDCSNKQSIELKSKESRARMHYQKFTRSKDINKYKLKDLANIFGQEELSSKIQTKIEKEKNNYDEEITETKDNWHGVVTINSGNMADYFKHKSNYKNMTDHLKYKLNNLSSNIIDNQVIDSKSENEQYVGFGFVSNTENTLSSNYGISKDCSEKSNYAFDNPCLRLNSPMETTNTDDFSKKSSKKKKKKKKELETDNLYVDEINKHDTRKKLETETINNCGDCSSNYGISKDSSEKSNAFDNPCLKLNSPMETINTDDSSKKSSKKKKKELETDHLYADEIKKHDTRKKLETETINNCSDCSFNGISKDSSEKSNAFDNPCLRLNSPIETTNTDDSSKKSSKKKKKKELETDNLYADEINKHDTKKKLETETINNCSDCSSNGISKDSSEKSNAFDNPCIQLNNSTETTSNDKSSKKSSKKKKECESNNLYTDEITEHDTRKKLETEAIDSNCNDCSSNYGISKDSNEKSNYAFDNPCLRLNNSTEITSTDGSSKKSSKKKKKKELEINNLYTDKVNEHDTGKKLETETIDNNCSDFSSNYEISKDSKEKSNYAFDNPCLRLNNSTEITSTDGSSKKSSKKKKKKELEINNLYTDEVNEHDIGKKLETETIDSNCNDFSSNYEISKDSSEKSNYAFDNPCLRLNSPTETTSTDGSSKKSSKKKKKELEINNLYTDEVNEHDTRKKLKTETIDNNCSDFSSNYEISKDSKEKSNYAFDNPCLRLNSPTDITSTDGSSKKSSKKRKKEFETDNIYTDEINEHNTRKKLKTETVDNNCSGFTNPALDLNSDSKEDCNGKEFEISRAQFGLENCGLDLTDETCDKKRVTFNDHIMLYEYDKNSIHSKKKKGKHTLDKFEVENKKHKKKQKCESITSPACQEDTEKLAKKDKKHKKSKNKNACNDENNPISNIEITVNNIQQGKVENVKLTDIFPESYQIVSVSNESVSKTHSPSNTKIRMSKKMLITLFHKNAISDFPGSNIHDIKGYGADDE